MPAKIEMPECRSTVVRISSMIRTVLPTPAPPEHGRLAAFDERREQIDDFDAGMKNLKRGP